MAMTQEQIDAALKEMSPDQRVMVDNLRRDYPSLPMEKILSMVKTQGMPGMLP